MHRDVKLNKDAPSRTNAGREVKETDAFLDGNGDNELITGNAESKRPSKPLPPPRLRFPESPSAAAALRRVTAIAVGDRERRERKARSFLFLCLLQSY